MVSTDELKAVVSEIYTAMASLRSEVFSAIGELRSSTGTHGSESQVSTDLAVRQLAALDRRRLFVDSAELDDDDFPPVSVQMQVPAKGAGVKGEVLGKGVSVARELRRLREEKELSAATAAAAAAASASAVSAAAATSKEEIAAPPPAVELELPEDHELLATQAAEIAKLRKSLTLSTERFDDLRITTVSSCLRDIERKATIRGTELFRIQQSQDSQDSYLEPDGEILEARKTYRMQENVWDASFLLDVLQSVERKENVRLVACLLINVCLQVTLCLQLILIILNDQEEEKGQVDDARMWSSMNSPVTKQMLCSSSFLLSSHFQQFELYFSYKKYKDDLSVLLAVIALVLWVLTITNVLQNLEDFRRALSAVPRTHRTTFMKKLNMVKLRSVSHTRYVWMSVIMGIQALVALALAFTGAMWIIQTTSTEDLILNAVALAYILEIDELMYKVMCPGVFKTALRTMHGLPMPMQHAHIMRHGLVMHLRTRHWHHPIFFFMVGAVPLFMVFWELVPRMKLMEEVMNTLCAGLDPLPQALP